MPTHNIQSHITLEGLGHLVCPPMPDITRLHLSLHLVYLAFRFAGDLSSECQQAAYKIVVGRWAYFVGLAHGFTFELFRFGLCLATLHAYGLLCLGRGLLCDRRVSTMQPRATYLALIPPFSMPLTAACETVLSAVFKASFAASTGPLFRIAPVVLNRRACLANP